MSIPKLHHVTTVVEGENIDPLEHVVALLPGPMSVYPFTVSPLTRRWGTLIGIVDGSVNPKVVASLGIAGVQANQRVTSISEPEFIDSVRSKDVRLHPEPDAGISSYP